MTTEQIKNTELTSQDIVARNMDVFAKESSLAMAKDIQGLRAIFEEVGADVMQGVNGTFYSPPPPPPRKARFRQVPFSQFRFRHPRIG